MAFLERARDQHKEGCQGVNLFLTSPLALTIIVVSAEDPTCKMETDSSHVGLRME
jgi:hypothetical protein